MLNKKMIRYESQTTKTVECFCATICNYKQHPYACSNMGSNSSRISGSLVYL
jgi:hypothetical protein